MATSHGPVAEHGGRMKKEITYRGAIRQLRILKQQHTPYCDDAIDKAIEALEIIDKNEEKWEVLLNETLRNRQGYHRVF